MIGGVRINRAPLANKYILFLLLGIFRWGKATLLLARPIFLYPVPFILQVQLPPIRTCDPDLSSIKPLFPYSFLKILQFLKLLGIIIFRSTPFNLFNALNHC